MVLIGQSNLSWKDLSAGEKAKYPGRNIYIKIPMGLPKAVINLNIPMNRTDHFSDLPGECRCHFKHISCCFILLQPDSLNYQQGVLRMIQVILSQFLVETGVMQGIEPDGIVTGFLDQTEPPPVIIPGGSQMSGLSSRQ